MNASKKAIATIFLAITMLIGMTALTGCGGANENVATDTERSTSNEETKNDATDQNTDSSENESSSNTESESADDAEDAVSYQAGMPVTLSANGKSYLVESYEVKINDDGNTVVVLYGSDFEMGSDWRDNMDAYLCFSADCEAGGQSYPAIIVSVQNMTSYQFEFEGSIIPDSITVYPQDDPDAKTTIQLEE